ncbi:MAG: hypothetical protein QOE05_3587 [Actinomycetota bacterium]|jgi:hypothetical protein|nr:hypothetical protein [Actinomycetota bacterium]
MTDTLQRPTRSTPRQPGPARRPLEAGLLGALWAVCAGLVAIAVPVLLVWAADARSGSGAADALRAVGQIWVVSHGAGLEVPGGMLGLTPLGLLALPLTLLLRAAGHGARECRVTTLRQAALLAASIGLPYGVLAAVVSAVAVTDAVRPVAWQALLAGCAVGAAGGFAGAVRAARLWPAVLPALPDRAARLVRATAIAVAVLVGGGALVTAAALARHLDRAGDLAAATAPGKVGGVALLLLGLALVPNAAVWGMSWLAGPGFHVGVGTAVGPYGTVLGPVPSLPLLAALPGPVPAWVGVVALGLPLLAGALAGIAVVRRLKGASWLVAAREAAFVGPCAGVVVGVLGWLSGGPAGGARLTDVGPTPWLLGLTVAGEVALGAVAGALLRRARTG